MNKLILALFNIQNFLVKIHADGDPAPVQNAANLLNTAYSYLKILATPLAILMVAVNGIQLISSASDQQQKRQSKNAIITIVVAMAILYWAPQIVQMITGTLG